MRTAFLFGVVLLGIAVSTSFGARAEEKDTGSVSTGSDRQGDVAEKDGKVRLFGRLHRDPSKDGGLFKPKESRSADEPENAASDAKPGEPVAKPGLFARLASKNQGKGQVNADSPDSEKSGGDSDAEGHQGLFAGLKLLGKKDPEPVAEKSGARAAAKDAEEPVVAAKTPKKKLEFPGNLFAGLMQPSPASKAPGDSPEGLVGKPKQHRPIFAFLSEPKQPDLEPADVAEGFAAALPKAGFYAIDENQDAFRERLAANSVVRVEKAGKSWSVVQLESGSAGLMRNDELRIASRDEAASFPVFKKKHVPMTLVHIDLDELPEQSPMGSDLPLGFGLLPPVDGMGE